MNSLKECLIIVFQQITNANQTGKTQTRDQSVTEYDGLEELFNLNLSVTAY